MKKLITIILTLIMTLYSEISQGADELHVTAEKPPQTAITITVEQLSEENEKTAETGLEGEVTEAETNGETPKEEASVIQETVVKECTEFTEESITEIEDDTVQCIDEGDQSLVEYETQIASQPNPFENDTPTKINDRPVEYYIGKGEDRPGGGDTLLNSNINQGVTKRSPLILRFKAE